MWKAEARKANILVVEVGHVGTRKILPVHTNVDDNADRASQASDGIEDITRCAVNHANEIRQRYRRDQRVAARLVAIRDEKLAGARVNGDQLMIKVQVSHGNKL